jgi:hypothetical protein
MSNNTFTKTYQDGTSLLEADLDSAFNSVSPAKSQLTLATTGSTSGDVLTSGGSVVEPSWSSPDTVVASTTAVGANALFAKVTSCTNTVANLIGVAMLASGANAIIAVANSQSVPAALFANNVNNAVTSVSATVANIHFNAVTAPNSTVADTILGVMTSCSASVANMIGTAMDASGANAVLADVSSITSTFANLSFAAITSPTNTNSNLVLANVTSCQASVSNLIVRASTLIGKLGSRNVNTTVSSGTTYTQVSGNTLATGISGTFQVSFDGYFQFTSVIGTSVAYTFDAYVARDGSISSAQFSWGAPAGAGGTNHIVPCRISYPVALTAAEIISVYCRHNQVTGSFIGTLYYVGVGPG